MSKKSNMRRTQKRKQTKAYNEAKVMARREEAARQQEAARQAYKEIKSLRRKRVFTAGAKAVIASVAIMLMFVAGLVSWSVVKNLRQRRDDQVQQGEASPSQMVSSDMVTGMPRSGAKELGAGLRFAGFAQTDGGYDGKGMFGGRVSAGNAEGIIAERESLERLWQEAAKARATEEGTSIADMTKASEPDGDTKPDKVNESRYKVVTTDDANGAGITEDASGQLDTRDSDVTDEQIRKLIESSEASSSR